jgi:hypothetical protein
MGIILLKLVFGIAHDFIRRHLVLKPWYLEGGFGDSE